MDVTCPTHFAKAAARICIFGLAHRNLLYHALCLFGDFLPHTGSEEPECASFYLALNWKTFHEAVGTHMSCGQGETTPGCIYTKWASACVSSSSIFWDLLLVSTQQVIPTAVRDPRNHSSLHLSPVLFWEQWIQFRVWCYIVHTVPLGPMSEPSTLTLLSSCPPCASFLMSYCLPTENG